MECTNDQRYEGDPQQPVPGQQNNIQIPIRVNFDEPNTEEPDSTIAPREDGRTGVRRARITKEMLKDMGYTADCPGCDYKRAGMEETRGHTEECRKTITEAWRQTEDGRIRLQRETERKGKAKKGDEKEDVSEGGRAEEEMEVELDDDQEAEGGKEMDEEMEMVRCLKEAIMNIEKDISKHADIMEMYCPPRCTAMAAEMRLKPGKAMDLTTGWDFTLQRHREAARKYVERVQPKLIVGSPESTMFSALQNLSRRHLSREGETKLVEAKWHIMSLIEMYRMQLQAGRWFVHEHPASATSWAMEEVRIMGKEEGVILTTADQCMYGRTIRRGPGVPDRKEMVHPVGEQAMPGVARSSDGNSFMHGSSSGDSSMHVRGQSADASVRMRTRFMTNSPFIAQELRRRCSGEHEHQSLASAKIKATTIYPKGICEAICRGLTKQMIDKEMSVCPLMKVSHNTEIGPAPLGNTTVHKRERGVDHEEFPMEEEEAYDDVSGEALDPKGVQRARMTEIGYIKDK